MTRTLCGQFRHINISPQGNHPAAHWKKGADTWIIGERGDLDGKKNGRFIAPVFCTISTC